MSTSSVGSNKSQTDQQTVAIILTFKPSWKWKVYIYIYIEYPI